MLAMCNIQNQGNTVWEGAQAGLTLCITYSGSDYCINMSCVFKQKFIPDLSLWGGGGRRGGGTGETGFATRRRVAKALLS